MQAYWGVENGKRKEVRAIRVVDKRSEKDLPKEQETRPFHSALHGETPQFLLAY
jgi:hypothetical protein